jgi:hypothetical protein
MGQKSGMKEPAEQILCGKLPPGSVLWVDRGSTGGEVLILPDTALNLQLPNRSPVSQ